MTNWEYCELIFRSEHEYYINPGYGSVDAPETAKPTGVLVKRVYPKSLSSDFRYILDEDETNGWLPTDQEVQCNHSGFNLFIAEMGAEGWEIINESNLEETKRDNFGVHHKHKFTRRLFFKRPLEVIHTEGGK